MIHAGRADERVRKQAVRILDDEAIPARDSWGEVDALFRFVQQRLRFTRDPIGNEMISRARALLDEHRDADCDEYVILLGSLLESVGHRVRLKVVRANARGPWRHIYLEVLIRQGGEDPVWVPADATRNEPLGWEVRHGDSFVVPIDEAAADIGWVGTALGLAGAALPLLGSKSDDDSGGGAEDAIKAAQKLLKQQTKVQRAQAFMDLVKSDLAAKKLAPAIVAAAKKPNASAAVQQLLGLASMSNDPVRVPVVADPLPTVAPASAPNGFDWKKWGPPLAVGAVVLLLGVSR